MCFFIIDPRAPKAPRTNNLYPYTTLFRSLTCAINVYTQTRTNGKPNPRYVHERTRLMALPPTAESIPTSAAAAPGGAAPVYRSALVLLATLFFMWGLLTVINNTLLPHLRRVFDLNYTPTTLIESVRLDGRRGGKGLGIMCRL